MKKALIIFIAAILFFPLAVSAHQPRLVADNQPVEIKNPQISQAFYGELKGEPALYRISSEKPFKLYAGLLSPAIENAKKDFSAIIVKGADSFDQFILVDSSENGRRVLGYLDGFSLEWKIFYEEFVGDDYWQGPEFPERKADEPIVGQEMPAGDYQIMVFSPDNLGKYVLVIGYLEEFPKEEAEKAAQVIPLIKTEFFGKSPWSVFEGKLGKYALFGLVFVFVLIVLAVWLVRKILDKFFK